MADKIKLELNYLKDTKGTYVYGVKDAGDEDFIPQLYIKKAAFGDKAPAKITLSITPSE